ncbi:MAG: BrnA antitoxin family protein [Bdellovibrionales bacterium]|nr:BrnA antitoxin family protein [Bdellovibrionales bacterium]
MKKEYDFSKGKRGYYNKKLTQDKVTIRLDDDVIIYFKKMAQEKGLPYQTLINLYLRSCKEEGLKINIDWKKHG